MLLYEPNVTLIDRFCDSATDLFHTLKKIVSWDERMRARKTASFGVAYEYSGITYPETEMHYELIPLCCKIENEMGFMPNNCLLNYYEDGNSSMGFHSDSSEELLDGTGIAIVSLGAERLITFKNKTDRNIIYNYALKNGDLLYMTKEMQADWLHAIPKLSNSGERISLTFRYIIK